MRLIPCPHLFVAVCTRVVSGTASFAAEEAARNNVEQKTNDSSSLVADGDRIVLVGNGLIEQAQKHGWLELTLTSAEPEKHLTFRNLGCRGDTVFGAARIPEPGAKGVEKGFDSLINQVRKSRPTVLIVGYGAVESESGPDGITDFEFGATRLLTELKKITPRILVVGPHLPDRPARTPETQQRIANTRLYSKVFERITRSLGLRYINLLAIFIDERSRMTTSDRWTLNEHGHRVVGQWIATVGMSSPDRGFGVHFKGSKLVSSRGGHVTDITQSNGALGFTVSRRALFRPGDYLSVRFEGLSSGLYGFEIDGVRQSRGVGTSNRYMASGVGYEIDERSPLCGDTSTLRAAIVEKNRLFFEAWRPSIEAGDRREQRPAPADLTSLDEQERRIAQLKKPKISMRFRLIRTNRPAGR